jgi:hypothetical protein
MEAVKINTYLQVGPYDWLTIIHPQPMLDPSGKMWRGTRYHRITYSSTIGCSFLSEYIAERLMKRSSILLTEPSTSNLVPGTAAYTMSPVMESSYCSPKKMRLEHTVLLEPFVESQPLACSWQVEQAPHNRKSFWSWW